MDSFVGSFFISFDGPVAKYLHVMQGPCLLFFQDDILGSLGSNLVFIIPFGILELYE
jgi:hypothetical protein